MSTGEPAERPDGSSRAAARAKARELREQHRKSERRRSAVIRTAIVVAVIAVVAVVAVVIVTSIHAPAKGPANMASDGIVIGKDLKAVRTPAARADADPVVTRQNDSSGTVSIVEYVDYLSLYSGQFQSTNAAQIGKLVRSGVATVEIHPVPFLASHSAGTQYSLRATNAAACVANFDPDGFWAFNNALFDHQPAENTVGLSNAQITSLVRAAKVQDLDSVSRCINDGRYQTWAQNALDRMLASPIPNSGITRFKGIPIVLVNGQQYTGSLKDADEFRAFILKAQATTYTTPTPGPTSTSTATGTPTETSTP